MSEPAGIVALSWVALSNEVVRSVPPNTTVAPLTKFVPVTVMASGPLPAIAADGFSWDSVGAGRGAGVTVKFTVFESGTPGLRTRTCFVPAVAILAAGIVTVSCVSLVVSGVSVVPPNTTLDALTKLEPLTVSVKAGDPSTAVLGLIPLIAGIPTTVKSTSFEISFPGAGLRTFTFTTPGVPRRLAGMVAFKEVALSNVVTRSVVPNTATDPVTNPVPATVITCSTF